MWRKIYFQHHRVTELPKPHRASTDGQAQGALPESGAHKQGRAPLTGAFTSGQKMSMSSCTSYSPPNLKP